MVLQQLSHLPVDPQFTSHPAAEVQAAPGHEVCRQPGSQANVPSAVHSEPDLEYDWQLHLLVAIVQVVRPAIGRIDCYR